MRRTLVPPIALAYSRLSCRRGTATAAAPKATKPSRAAFPVSVTSAAGTVRIAQRPDTDLVPFSERDPDALRDRRGPRSSGSTSTRGTRPTPLARTSPATSRVPRTTWQSARTSSSCRTDTTDLVAQLKTLGVATLAVAGG